MIVVLLAFFGCGGPCDDPGEAVVHCDQSWTEEGEPASAVYADEAISCVDYSESGDQQYQATVSGCGRDVTGRTDGVCTCTKDTSACSFPCGKND